MKQYLNILVIDDDELARQTIRDYLSHTEFQVAITEAIDAAMARQAIAQAKFDCVLLDNQLPDADGIDLIKQFRLEGIAIPIIVLTSHGGEQIAVDLMKAGASDYLTKVRLSPEHLASLIRNAMKVYLAEQGIQHAQKQLQQTNQLLRQQNRELAKQRHQIEQQNLELLETNRVKSEFLAMVTHELRTPLNAILGFSQILKSQTKGVLNNYQMEMVNRIFTNGENLLNMVNEILDTSLVEMEQLELAPSTFDLNRLVCITLAELQPLATRKGLSINLSDQLKEANVYNDETRLKQVLVNLISNAIKFTNQGGINIQIKAVAANGIEIMIRDTGIGIPSEQVDHIFEPFHQSDQTSQRSHSGSGLGLAIAHSLVSMMDGWISVDSVVGEGSTFWVRIPRQIATTAVNAAGATTG